MVCFSFVITVIWLARRVLENFHFDKVDEVDMDLLWVVGVEQWLQE